MESKAADPASQANGSIRVPAYAWVILVVTLLIGVCAPFNQFKIPPVMPILMEKFSINLTSAGLLMSIFAITGLIFAIPAGILLQRFGLKTTGLAAGMCLLAGTILGAFSNNYGLLFFSRLVEGIGMALIGLVGPAAIAAWFPAESRGLPMGIWATWVSLGSLMIYTSAPAVEAAGGLSAVWWMAAGLTGLAVIVFALFFRLPPGRETASNPVRSSGLADMKKALRHKEIWRLALAFGCFNYAIIGVIATYYPTYLKAVQGYDLAGASMVTSIKMIVVIITAPLVGWLVDRVGSPRKIILWSFIALAVFMALPFSISGWMIPASMVLLGLLAGAIPTCTFTCVPELAGKEIPAGMALAVILIGQNLGQLLGPVLFGALTQSLGWTIAGYLTVPVLILGFIEIKRTSMK
jgi:MFS family permease